jgi:two-component sensor histidine kinase/HAMP domain-containing protein
MKNIKSLFSDNSKQVWYKGIFFRTALLSWILISLTLLTFILGTLPYQLEVVKTRMNSEANDISGSIGQVTATAIINDDYGFAVDHCLKIIKQSKSILYIVITRKDGFSLIHTENGWKQEMPGTKIRINPVKTPTSLIKHSNIVNEEVYQYSYPFEYSGIDWGWISVGLSLKNYNQNVYYLYSRTIGIAVLLIFVGLLASVYFAKKLTLPIRQLDMVARSVASGDLNARVSINTENELGRLANSFNKMTESLKSSQDNLENTVEERTAELERINRILHIEIKERLAAEQALRQYNLRLETLDKIYTGIISAKSVEEIIIETINHMPRLFPLANRASVDLFDLRASSDVVFLKDFDSNKNNSEHSRKKDNAHNNIKSFTRHINTKEINKGSLNEFYTSEIKSVINAPLIIEEEKIGTISIGSSVDNYFNDNHIEVLFILANQLALAIFQAQLQDKIRQHAKNLQNSLSEKEVLLKEIHHRVKNNLQIISSLLYLQSTKAKDEETLHLFEDSQNRIKSMALIHEKLYQSKDFSNVSFNEYVNGLLEYLNASYRQSGCKISTNINIEDINLSLDTAISCGLIVNELFTNAYKYAFPPEWLKEQDKINCTIEISVSKIEAQHYYMKVSDNGIGIPESLEIGKATTLGLKLVNSMVRQMDGSIEIVREKGSHFFIKFTDLK